MTSPDQCRCSSSPEATIRYSFSNHRVGFKVICTSCGKLKRWVKLDGRSYRSEPLNNKAS